MHTMIFYILLFLNIASAGLVTGGAMVMLFAYTPLLAELPPYETILVHRGIGRYVDRWQPKLAVLALLTGVVELFFSHQPWQTIFIALGIAGIFGLSIISHTMSVPLARKMIAWMPGPDKQPLDHMKTQWIHIHYTRSICGLLGFLFFIVSLLLLVSA